MFCKFATAWQDEIKMINQGKMLFEVLNHQFCEEMCCRRYKTWKNIYHA